MPELPACLRAIDELSKLPPLTAAAAPPRLDLRYVRYDPRSIGAEALERARALRKRLENGEDHFEKWEWTCFDMEDFTKMEFDADRGWWWPSNRDRCAADWRPGRVTLETLGELEYHGGHGSGLRAKCPLHLDTAGQRTYIEYITNECMDPDCGENELLDMSGLYYSFDVDPPPGPLSELFTFFVRVYLRPVDADGDWNRWARFIDLDAPMPPLRPYAIAISLRPSQEMNDGMTQESYAYFLDNMIFK